MKVMEENLTVTYVYCVLLVTPVRMCICVAIDTYVLYSMEDVLFYWLQLWVIHSIAHTGKPLLSDTQWVMKSVSDCEVVRLRSDSKCTLTWRLYLISWSD